MFGFRTTTIAVTIAASICFGFISAVSAQTKEVTEPEMRCGLQRHLEVILDIDRKTAGGPLEVIGRNCVPGGAKSNTYKVTGLDNIEFVSYQEASSMFEAIKDLDWKYSDPAKLQAMLNFVWKLRERKVAGQVGASPTK